MKTTTHIFILLGLFLCSLTATPQNIVKVSKEHKISSKAGKPGALIDFVVETDKNEISLKYLTKDNKRKIMYETYTYDLESLKEKDVAETEIEKEKARKKFRLFDDSEPTRLVRVRNNMAQQMVLERGYIKQVYYDNHVNTSFETEQKEKFKDPQDRRQTMVAYRTDAQEYSLNLNTWSDAFKAGSTHKAEGNALIITSVVPKIVKGEIPGAKFNVMIIASENLSVVSEKELDFEFPHYVIAKANLSDGGMAVVFKPLNRGAIGGSEVHPVKQNLNEHTLLTIDKEGNETGRYTFEIKQQHADLNLVLTPNGDFLIYGFADELDVSPNDKAPNCTPIYGLEGINKEGNRIETPKTFEMVKVSKTGETVFSTSTPLKKVLESTSTFADEKVKLPKVDKWDKHFKSDVHTGPIVEVGGNFYVQLNSEDYYQLMQFDNTGAFQISYFTEPEGDKLSESQVTMGPGASIYWMNFEFDEGKGNEIWMKTALIDPASKSIKAMEIPGEQKFFVLGSASFAAAPGEVVFYFQNGKNIYLGKLPVK